MFGTTTMRHVDEVMQTVSRLLPPATWQRGREALHHNDAAAEKLQHIVFSVHRAYGDSPEWQQFRSGLEFRYWKEELLFHNHAAITIADSGVIHFFPVQPATQRVPIRWRERPPKRELSS